MEKRLAIDIGGSKVLVGGALYLNGSLYVGANSCAGEFGHIRVEENGKACTCGKKGCLESVASGREVSAYYKEKLGRTGRRKRLARLQTKAMKSQLRHTGARQKHRVRSLRKPRLFLT